MAKRRRFKCGKCDRLFLMAAHLARHMNTIHARKAMSKTAKKKPARRVVRRKVPRRAVRTAARRPAIGGASITSQLRRFQRQLADKREALNSQIDAIEKALAAMGDGAAKAKPGPGRRRRTGGGPPAGSLKDYIGRVLRGRRTPMAVKDIMAGVRKAGYKTKNKTLANSIGKALVEMPGVVKVGRGQYRSK